MGAEFAERFDVDQRTTRLEADMGHIKADLAAIKADVRMLRDRSEGVKDTLSEKIDRVKDSLLEKIEKVNDSLAEKIDEIKSRQAADRVWALLIAGSILGVLARGFHWI